MAKYCGMRALSFSSSAIDQTLRHRILLLGSDMPMGGKAEEVLSRNFYCAGISCMPAENNIRTLDLRDSTRAAAFVFYERTDTVIWDMESILPYLADTAAEELLLLLSATLNKLVSACKHIAVLYNAYPAVSHPHYLWLSEQLIERLKQTASSYAVFRIPALYSSTFQTEPSDRPVVLADAAALFIAEHLNQCGEFYVTNPKGLDGKKIIMHQEHCVFQLIYKLGAVQQYRGHSVASLRQQLGQALVRAIPVAVQQQIDYICPVPRTGLYYGMGLAQKLEKPYVQGLIKTTPQERSFQLADADERKKFLWSRLYPLQELLCGKRVALVDEAIFTGATLKVVCEMLHECDVKALYLCIPTPKCRYHCNYLAHPPRPMLLEYMKDSMLEDYFNCDGVYFQSDENFKAILDAIDPGMCAECFWGGDERNE